MDMQVSGEEEHYFSDPSDEEGDETEENLSSQGSQLSSQISVNNNATRAGRNRVASEDNEEGQIDSENEIEFNQSNDAHASLKLDAAQKEEMIGEMLAHVREMFDQSGIAETASLIKQHFGKVAQQENPGKKKGNTKPVTGVEKLSDAVSDLTVYKNAVADKTGKHFSSSSEEGNRLI